MIFGLNVGFSKGKREIFASMGDLRKRVIFGLNGGFEKTHDFRVKWGILEEKMLGFLV